MSHTTYLLARQLTAMATVQQMSFGDYSKYGVQKDWRNTRQDFESKRRSCDCIHGRVMDRLASITTENPGFGTQMFTKYFCEIPWFYNKKSVGSLWTSKHLTHKQVEKVLPKYEM